MKKIIVSISFILTVILCNTSCSDYLDIVPEGTPDMETAFSNKTNARKFREYDSERRRPYSLRPLP